MFSKNKNVPSPQSTGQKPSSTPDVDHTEKSQDAGLASAVPAPKPKPPASILSPDLVIKGNLRTTGDIQIEGKVEGDIRAHLLTVGEGAIVKGEIISDDVVVNGRVIGRVRGLKVRLTSTAQVEGDIIHKTIAIESGAHFEGSVQRQEDPLKKATGAGSTSSTGKAAPNPPSAGGTVSAATAAPVSPKINR